MYWKVVIRYGHVGQGNEIAVARYLKFQGNVTSLDVIQEVSNMPGTKNKSYCSISKITEQQYNEGKKQESENFYLQNLFGATAS